MVQRNNIFIFRFLVLGLFGLILMSGCEKEKELQTDLLSGKEIGVEAYGPNPALRGQKITFVGTRLNQITKVVFTPGVEVTDIDVISDLLIKVTVPPSAEEGPVQLFSGEGLEFSFDTPLAISEPISISSMSPQPVKAGQTLTIEGDYLDLIQKVIFSDKVEKGSEDFEVHERTKIVLDVPAEAQSGYIVLSDTAEIPLEYESLERLEVVLPSVKEILELSEQKPGNTIVVKGKDLDLVTQVQAPNGEEIPFSLEEEELTFILPDNISDGVIAMVPASGVMVEVAHIEVAIPDELEVQPTTKLRGGDEIVIKGKNLELVSGVRFPEVEESVEPLTQSETEIQVIFPDAAISGEMILELGSGKSVAVPIETQKPGIHSFENLPASAGGELIIKGENLDLITSVIFPEGGEVEVNGSAKDELSIVVPLNATSGVLVLTMANGEWVESPELEISMPVFCFIPDPPGPKAEIRAGGVLTVQVENGERLNEVRIGGISVNFIVDAPNLYVVIPGNASGDTDLILISDNGEAHYWIPVIGSGIVETIIYDDELFELNWGEPLRLDKDLFENIPAGSKLKIYMAAAPEGASIAYSDANWEKLIIDDPNFDTQWETISVPEGAVDYEIELTGEILEKILSVSDGWSETALMLTGDGVMVSKISLIVGEEAEETTLFEGSYDLVWSEGLRIDKADLEEVRPGSVMKLYITASEGASFAVLDANWGYLVFPDDPNFDPEWNSISVEEGTDVYEIVLTAEHLETAMTVDDGWSNTAIMLTGDGITISKITWME